MSKSKLSRSELEVENVKLRAELKYGNKTTWMDIVNNIINTIPKYFAYCVIALLAYLAIAELAGKITIANIDVDAMVKYITKEEVSKPNYFLWLSFFANLILGWAMFKSNLRRRRLIKKHGKLQEKYYNQIDPEKQSSGLDPFGELTGGTQ